MAANNTYITIISTKMYGENRSTLFNSENFMNNAPEYILHDEVRYMI